VIAIYQANATYQPTGTVLSSSSIPVASIGWAPRNIIVTPNIAVTSGTRYAIVVRSATTAGSYGLEYNDAAPYPGGGAAYSNNSGTSFTAETNRTLKFYTTVTGGTSVKTLPAAPVFSVALSAAHAAIKVNVPAGKSHCMKLLDIQGKLLAERKGFGKQTYSCASLKPGIYMVMVIIEGTLVSKKVALY
jgi:hypothetical protein